MLSLLIGYYAVRHLVLILTLKWAKLIFKHRQSSWVCKHLQFLLTCLHSSLGGESALGWIALCWWGWSGNLPLISCLFSLPGLDGKQRFQWAKATMKTCSVFGWVEGVRDDCFLHPEGMLATSQHLGVMLETQIWVPALLGSDLPFQITPWMCETSVNDVEAPKPIYPNKKI